MPDLNPTIGGRLLQSKTNFNTAAWEDAMPDQDSTAAVAVDDGHQDRTIETLFGYAASTITVVDQRCMVLSFNTSGVSAAPSSATLKIFGKVNTGTGNPASHSTNGILGLKTTMASTSAVNASDWGGIDQSGAGPILYTDTVTSWNKVGDSTEFNTFTLNSTALTDMGNNSTFQIAIMHKAFYDYYDTNPPFAHGNNSPNGDNDIAMYAGAYFGTISGQEAYKPVLTYTEAVSAAPSPKPRFKIVSGNLIVSSGKLTIK